MSDQLTQKATQRPTRQRVRFGRPPNIPVEAAETITVGIGTPVRKKAIASAPSTPPAPPAPPQLPEAA